MNYIDNLENRTNADMDYTEWETIDPYAEKLKKRLIKLQKKSRKDKKRIKKLEYGYGQLQSEYHQMKQVMEVMAKVLYQNQQFVAQLQMSQTKYGNSSMWRDVAMRTVPQVASAIAVACIGGGLAGRGHQALSSGK